MKIIKLIVNADKIYAIQPGLKLKLGKIQETIVELIVFVIISKKKLYSVLNPKMYSSVIVNYLSTSPIFTAKLPNITTRSDIFHPIRRGLSTVRFINDGDLILHRYGAMPPSLTK